MNYAPVGGESGAEGGGGGGGSAGGGLLIIDGVSPSSPFPPSFPRFLTPPPLIALMFGFSEVEVAKWNQEPLMLLQLHTFLLCSF